MFFFLSAAAAASSSPHPPRVQDGYAVFTRLHNKQHRTVERKRETARVTQQALAASHPANYCAQRRAMSRTPQGDTAVSSVSNLQHLCRRLPTVPCWRGRSAAAQLPLMITPTSVQRVKYSTTFGCKHANGVRDGLRHKNFAACAAGDASGRVFCRNGEHIAADFYTTKSTICVQSRLYNIKL